MDIPKCEFSSTAYAHTSFRTPKGVRSRFHSWSASAESILHIRMAIYWARRNNKIVVVSEFCNMTIALTTIGFHMLLGVAIIEYTRHSGS
jgi:hypothetical protein